METIPFLLHGFSLALTPGNLLAALFGALMGTLVGVLPGIGPSCALAILIPFTGLLPPEAMVIAMAGIYYGAQYGGSTTAILLNMPGEVSSIPTCLDGYQLARQGLAGVALGVAAIGSFAAATIGVIALTVLGPLVAQQAARFGPPEFFGLMLMALSIVASLSGASLAKGLAAGVVGYVLSLVGLDRTQGIPRFTFGFSDLLGGISLISVVTGLFAIAEVLDGLEERRRAVALKGIGQVFPKWHDLKRTFPSMARGGVVGFLLGLLPGCSPAITVFFAYDLEKRSSRHPERFGQGALEGVAAPEAANNATAISGFIPLLSLGIPPSPPLAILLGGLMIYGVQPGPLLFKEHPDLVWTVIASMYIGNLMLLVLNLPLVGAWARLTTVPYGVIAPVILLLSVVGTFSINNNMFDVWVSLAFGLLGYLMKKSGWPMVPLVLCLILGPILEQSLLQSLMLFHGNPAGFLRRPLAATLILLAFALTGFVLVSQRKVCQRWAIDISGQADGRR